MLQLASLLPVWVVPNVLEPLLQSQFTARPMQVRALCILRLLQCQCKACAAAGQLAAGLGGTQHAGATARLMQVRLLCILRLLQCQCKASEAPCELVDGVGCARRDAVAVHVTADAGGRTALPCTVHVCWHSSRAVCAAPLQAQP